MTIKRSKLHSLLHDYVAGDLDAAARAAVEKIAHDDPAARALLEEARAAHEALLSLRQRPEPPVRAEDAFPRIQASLARSGFEARPKLYLEGRRSRFYRRLAIAASLLCAATVGLFVMDRAGTDTAAPSPASAARPTAAQRNLEPFVEAGRRREGLSAAEWARMLERMGMRPSDLRLSAPDTAVPVSNELPEDR